MCFAINSSFLVSIELLYYYHYYYYCYSNTTSTHYSLPTSSVHLFITIISIVVEGIVTGLGGSLPSWHISHVHLVLLKCDLPHLKDVIIGTGGHHQALIHVPRDVTDSGGMSAVDKNKLWRSISLFLLRLLGAAAGQVPNHDSSVCT